MKCTPIYTTGQTYKRENALIIFILFTGWSKLKMKLYQILILTFHFVVFLLQNVCLQMEKAQETTSTSRGKLTTKSPVRNKRMLKMVEQRFMSFLGVKGTPTKTLNKELKVPEHLLKLYYKWSDDNFKDYDKNNADTARVVYHSSQYLFIYLFIFIFTIVVA